MIIRPATAADANAVADIDLAAKAAALADVRWAHTPDEVRAWIAGTLIPAGNVWVADEAGEILGYMALHDDFVGQLYLRPDSWRRGIGRQLLDHAKALRPDGLQLYCFQCNTRARSFYEAQGFTATRFTDGTDNEEREADILYAWAPKGQG